MSELEQSIKREQDERRVRNLEVCDRLHAALRIHAKLRRGEPIDERDRRTVAGLIRALVEEWV